MLSWLPCSPNENADASQRFKPHLGGLPGTVDIGYLSSVFIFSFLLAKDRRVPGANMTRDIFSAYGGVELLEQ